MITWVFEAVYFLFVSFENKHQIELDIEEIKSMQFCGDSLTRLVEKIISNDYFKEDLENY